MPVEVKGLSHLYFIDIWIIGSRSYDENEFLLETCVTHLNWFPELSKLSHLGSISYNHNVCYVGTILLCAVCCIQPVYLLVRSKFFGQRCFDLLALISRT
uniref:Uncharacterized protein n=1 Tax=Cacopsylla melanoneura TaxID=428564 RepID=A0A8D8TH72_9HEMI